jgi:hypothetical protein
MAERITRHRRWLLSALGAAVCAGSLVSVIFAQSKPPQPQSSQQPNPDTTQSNDQDKDRFQIRVKPGSPDSANGEAAEKKPASLPDFRKGAKNNDPNNTAPNDRYSEYGTLPSSSFHDGGTYLPVRDRVSEVFQHLDPREQVPQGQLFGSQLPPVLLEYRVLNKILKPGDEVHVVARVQAVNKARPFVSLFTHAEYGRSTAMVYVNFEQNKKDPQQFLGRGTLPKYLAPGRYVIGDTIISDENGHRKAYWPDWNPVLQESDGTPVGFTVPENPDADVTPPALRSIKVQETRARIGQNIHTEICVTDDKAGVADAQAYWISPTEAQSIRADFVAVPNEPCIMRSSFQVPEWYEGGDWRLLSIRLSDKSTNEVNMFPPSFPMMRDVRVHIDQDPAKVDKTPPRLIAVQLSHEEVARDKSVDITIIAEDDQSGVKEVYISFLAPYGADFERVKLSNEPVELNRRSAGKQANVWRGALRIKPAQEPGRWMVSRVNLADNAGNYSNYNAVRDPLLKDLSVVFIDPRMKAKTTTEDHK